MNSFVEFLNQVSPLSIEAKLDLERSIKYEEFDKDQSILTSGQTCNHIYFLDTGFVRIFYYKSGKDITEHFVSEHNVFGSINSLINRTESELAIETLDACQLYSLSHTKLEEMYDKHHGFERVGRILALKAFLTIQARLYSLQFHTATQRYHDLLQENPNILQRAPLGHIASYLGITQVTLSRIRAQR